MELKKITPGRMKIILNINNNKPTNTCRLSRDIKMTYSHVVKVIRELEAEKILTLEFNGRANELKLTDKGIKFRAIILVLKQL